MPVSMPLYEYECQNGHRFEKIQKFSDPPIEVCPTCGGKVEKLISTPAIQFKGSGWYITDYARKGESSSDGSGAKADKASDKTSEKTSSDTSTATPTSGSTSSETKTSKTAESSPATSSSSKSEK